MQTQKADSWGIPWLRYLPGTAHPGALGNTGFRLATRDSTAFLAPRRRVASSVIRSIPCAGLPYPTHTHTHTHTHSPPAPPPTAPTHAETPTPTPNTCSPLETSVRCALGLNSAAGSAALGRRRTGERAGHSRVSRWVGEGLREPRPWDPAEAVDTQFP